MPLDEDAAAVLAATQTAEPVDPFSLTPEQFRANSGNLSGDRKGPDMARVEMRMIDGPDTPIPARIFTPHTDQEGLRPGLVFFHGGGFVICDLDTHDATCRDLAAGAGCIVVSVDYRLAPEAKFPAAPEDCYAATLWATKNAAELGIDADRIAVAGDSAGGNLAAAVALMARDRKGPALVHQLLIYPTTDHAFGTGSYLENGKDYFLTIDMMRWFWHHYLESDADGDNPLASPLRAPDLAGLPPATVLTADFDPLRDEGKAYADRLDAAGVPTTSINYPGVFHGFFSMVGAVARARVAVDDACAALRASFVA